MKAERGGGQELRDAITGIARTAGFSGVPPAIEELPGDGSERRFYRLRHRDRHAILLISPRKKYDGIDENDSYFLIGKHLFQHRVPVPRFLWTDVARGVFLLEDLGDCHLQSLARRRRGNLFSLYGRVVQLLVDLHHRAPDGFEAGYCFDSAVYDAAFVYQRELEYFRERFLNGCLGWHIGPDDLRPDFEKLAEAAGDASRSQVIHRDFQSRNIMVRAQTLRLIDFQGMRFGPPAYDLASMLIDPYVGIPHRLESRLVARYWTKAGKNLGCSFQHFVESYRVLRLCRNFQILGAYGYLGVVKGKRHFLGYVPLAWQQLRFWVNGAADGRYPAVQRLVNRIHQAQPPVLGGKAGAKVLRDKHPRKSYKPLSPDRELD